MKKRLVGTIAAAVALTVPWVVVWMLTAGLPAVGYDPAPFGGLSTLATVAISGVSILGAAFLLAWAAETAEKDVPRAFAIAILAVLAVAPEYAVDALYAWNAGQFAGTQRGIEAGNLAVANMTGANRILIGLGWSGIALFTMFRRKSGVDPAVENREGFLRNAVSIDPDISLEIAFLLLATFWAFLVPLNGGIDIFDMLFLVGLYLTYIAIVIRGDIEPEDVHTGVPAALQRLSRPARITSIVLLFAYSGFVIFVAVEPFAHGLEELGTDAGIPPFFMIQWIAPLASESPELIVVAYLVNKARSTAGFNALISSKLNQWTLLIGTLVVVYSLALGRYGALPFDQKQSAEIWLTAAQSFFAIALLIDFELTAREAIALLVLFVSQVLFEFIIIRELLVLPLSSYELLIAYSVVYIVLGLVLFVRRRDEFRSLIGRTVGTITSAFSGGERTQRADD